MTSRQSHALTVIEAQLDTLEEVTDRQLDEKRAHAVLARMFALVWQLPQPEVALMFDGEPSVWNEDMLVPAGVKLGNLIEPDDSPKAHVYPRSDRRSNPGTEDFNRFMDGVMPD